MIRKAAAEDAGKCIELVELVKDDFVGYEKDGFAKALNDCIVKNQAVLACENGIAAGLLLFSKDEKELQFLAVHPDHRRKGLAKSMMDEMIGAFDAGDKVEVTTFDNGDQKGIAARACYHSYGFVDGERLMVFGYPCQKMIYTVK